MYHQGIIRQRFPLNLCYWIGSSAQNFFGTSFQAQKRENYTKFNEMQNLLFDFLEQMVNFWFNGSIQSSFWKYNFQCFSWQHHWAKLCQNMALSS